MVVRQRNNVMKRLVVAVVVVSCLVRAWAMPTRAELTKAQPLVVELMAPAMETYKTAGAQEKTAAAVKVGDTSSEFAKAAETEAARFLLLKGAVNFYTRGEAYDKAADAVAALQTTVKDVTPAVIAEITGKATSKISETKAPRLFALYRSAKLQVRAVSEAKTLAQKLKKVKSDALQRRYAEALAVSGDWKKAYGEFAKLSDAKLKAVVEAEAKGKAKNAESGEFWWAYEPEMEDAADFFKTHAAAFYRQALAAGEITGLKKNIVEQRIKDYGESGEVARGGQGTSPHTPAASGLYCVIDLSGGPDAKKYPVSYLNDVPKGGWSDEYKTTKLVLRRIEPGAFMMGEKGKGRHVAIKEPFYMGVFEVTQKQWSLIIGDRPSFWKGPQWSVRPVEQVSFERIRGKGLGSKWPESDEVDEYSFMWLLRQKTNLRFDLPSEAQWEYACRAGTDTDYYTGEQCKGYRHDPSADKIGRYMRNGGWDEEKWGKFDWGKAWSAPDRDCTSEHGTASVGTYVPNNWGFYDMSGNVAEMCLDRFDDEKKPNEVFRAARGGRWFAAAAELKSISSERCGCGGNGWFGHGFRLCLPLAGGAPTAPAATTPSMGSIELKTGGNSPFTVKGNEATLKLPNGEVIEFILCPAGKFKMFRGQGASSDVTMSRPFWMSRTPITGKAAANAVGQDVKVSGRYCAFGSQFGSERVISWLQNGYSSFLPKGAVLRQPSIAELQYAFCANGKASDATYNLFTKNEDVKVKIFCDYKGERKTAPNAWGFYDFSGLEYVLDRIDTVSVTSWENKESGKMRMLPEPSNMTDAFYWTDADVSTQYIVHRDVWWCSKNVGGPFHLVIGPDLVSEWKAKNGKK